MKGLEIIYENSEYIVVNKEAGLISEKSRFEDHTVEDQVLKHLSSTSKKPFVGVIHRLDRVTSGALIFAKKKSVLVKFNQLFSARKVQKTYLAIVQSKPPKMQDELKNHLIINRQDKRAEIIQEKSKESLECSLTYRLVSENKYGFLLEITPKTGRFHQIRAQLAHIGSPILGDEKYGSDQRYKPLSICLHAADISFLSPSTEKMEKYKAPVPKNNFWSFESGL